MLSILMMGCIIGTRWISYRRWIAYRRPHPALGGRFSDKEGESSLTQRIPCIMKGCSATILPATAAKTGGYCMPCQQELARQERQRYIEEHSKDVNLFEGLSDPVEILKVMYAPRSYDPLIRYIPYPRSKEQIYLSLSAEEEDRILLHAMELLASGDKDTYEEILLSLVCFRDKSITEHIPALIAHGLYGSGILLKDASQQMRNELLNRVGLDKENRNFLLLVLAWIGDEQVIARFREWRHNPPAWVDELYVAPEQYSQEAGWELTESGERRDLFFRTSYAIEKQCTAGITSGGGISLEEGEQSKLTQQDQGIKQPIRILASSPNHCPWCGKMLTTLLELNMNHPSLQFLPLTGECFKIDTCISCGAYEVIYMDADGDGEPSWSRYNKIPSYLPEPDADHEDSEHLTGSACFKLAAKPRNVYHSAHWMVNATNSQVGGHPCWIQDAHYPSCPNCLQHMTFIAQLDWEDIEEYGEGIYYMFVCPDCRITATTYQQT